MITTCRIPISSDSQERGRTQTTLPEPVASVTVATVDLLKRGTHRLVMDSRRERDRFDALTDRNFSYDHNHSKLEPLCWIADATGWCFGAGGDWRRRITPIAEDVIEFWIARNP